MSKLRPCPFCGSTEIDITLEADLEGIHREGCKVGFMPDPEQVAEYIVQGLVKQWSKREEH